MTCPDVKFYGLFASITINGSYGKAWVVLYIKAAAQRGSGKKSESSQSWVTKNTEKY